MDVTQIQNVKGHLSVELIIALYNNSESDAAQSSVIITLTVQVENVMLKIINAA